MIEKRKQRKKRKEKKSKKGCLLGREILFFLSNLKDLERRRRRRRKHSFHSRGVRNYLPTYYYCYSWRRELNLFFPIARKEKKADAILLVPPGEYLTLNCLSSIPSASLQPVRTYLPNTQEIYVPGDNMTKVHTPSVRPSALPCLPAVVSSRTPVHRIVGVGSDHFTSHHFTSDYLPTLPPSQPV